jgi:hypothetical protein
MKNDFRGSSMDKRLGNTGLEAKELASFLFCLWLSPVEVDAVLLANESRGRCFAYSNSSRTVVREAFEEFRE